MTADIAAENFVDAVGTGVKLTRLRTEFGCLDIEFICWNWLLCLPADIGVFLRLAYATYYPAPTPLLPLSIALKTALSSDE